MWELLILLKLISRCEYEYRILGAILTSFESSNFKSGRYVHSVLPACLYIFQSLLFSCLNKYIFFISTTKCYSNIIK